MKEKRFCRCCLSKECYKDMANTYYIGNKTENYVDMLLNTFNVDIKKDGVQRCLICEECVSMLRNASAFKKKVLDVQETIKTSLCREYNDTYNIDTKIEDEEADYFDDNISDTDFKWENFTPDISQKRQIFFVTLESNCKTLKYKAISKLKKTKASEIRIVREESSTLGAKKNVKAKNTITLGSTEKDKHAKLSTLDATEKDEPKKPNTLGAKEKDEDTLDQIVNDSDDNYNDFDSNGEDSDYTNTEVLDSEDNFKIDKKTEEGINRTPAKGLVKSKAGTNKQTKEINKIKPKRREISEEQSVIKHKSEDTMKLVQNSNLCLFRSLRNKFGCNFCKMNFPLFSQLREHSLTHKNPRLSDLKRLRGLTFKNADISDLECNLCSEKCSDLEYLQEHLKIEHQITFHGTEYYLVPYKLQEGNQCVLCELKFNTYMRLSVHMNSHYMNNVCESCGLSFINRSGLRTHVKAMHKEKKCSRCPAIFVTNSSKIKHLKQVHGVRPSKRSICNICNKTFKYTYILDEHKILEHGFKRPAVSTCGECGKTFMTALKLKTHVRSVHIRERKYPCTKCDMRFFTTCDQKRHERTHEDVRSFSCSYCDAKFKSKDSWRRHLKRQHGHVLQSMVT